MLFEIHPPMKDADYINAALAQTKEKDVRTRAIFVVTITHFGTRPPDSRLCRNGIHILPELAGISLGLTETPAACCVVPDFIKV